MIDIEKISQTLEKVSSNYSETSEEYEAIKLAAIALHFAWQEEVHMRFQSFLDNFDRDLTEAEQAHLRNMGII